MARKGEHDYFRMMKDMAVCAHSAAVNLKGTLGDYDPQKLDAMLREMHDIEHHGDDLKHQLVGKLAKEFITPIEREDIMTLVDIADDVIDCVEDVLIKIYMYNIQSILPEAMEFAEVVCECTREMVTVFEEFADFKKSKKIHTSIIEINRLEEVGDALYIRAVRKLFENGTDAMAALAWSEIFFRLEKCCDTCEHVADLITNVIMKNT